MWVLLNRNNWPSTGTYWYRYRMGTPDTVRFVGQYAYFGTNPVRRKAVFTYEGKYQIWLPAVQPPPY